MKIFSPDFQKQLDETVQDFEQKTSAELVLAVCSRSGVYTTSAWIAGAALAFIGFTIFMFIPFEFFDDEIYVGSILSFLLGYVVVRFVPAFQRLLTKRALLRNQCELAAHALFSQRGIHRTKGETGFLVYVSVLEQETVVVADRGIAKALDKKVLENLEKDLQQIWAKPSLDAALKAIFAQYATPFSEALPRLANDENELDNVLETNRKGYPRFLHGGFGAKQFTV